MILILFKGAMPLLFEQPRAELAGPALIKMRAGGETIGGENQKEKEKFLTQNPPCLLQPHPLRVALTVAWWNVQIVVFANLFNVGALGTTRLWMRPR